MLMDTISEKIASVSYFGSNYADVCDCNMWYKDAVV